MSCIDVRKGTWRHSQHCSDKGFTNEHLDHNLFASPQPWFGIVLIPAWVSWKITTNYLRNNSCQTSWHFLTSHNEWLSSERSTGYLLASIASLEPSYFENFHSSCSFSSQPWHYLYPLGGIFLTQENLNKFQDCRRALLFDDCGSCLGKTPNIDLPF